MKKKIVVFMNSMSNAGGIERVISNLLVELGALFDVTLLVKDSVDASFYPIPETINIVSIGEPLVVDMMRRRHRICTFFINYLKCYKKLKNFFESVQCDFIYTTSPLNSLEIAQLGKKYRKKLVISEHSSAFAVNKVYQIIKKVVYPKAYCITVPNKTDVKIYDEWGCNTVYIPHLVTFNGQKKNHLESKILLNIGRYTADKRQALLIDIWARVRNKNGWKLWIVGEGEEKDSLHNKIREHGIDDSVFLVPATKKISDIYSEASLFVFTSRMEGFGMVLLEAMAFGIPCISFDCPSGPRDIISDGYNGFLISNDDIEAFSQCLEDVINDKSALLNQLGNNAYKTVTEWNNEEILKKWKIVFR